MSRVEATVLLTNIRGLHARASAKFVQVAGGFESEVIVHKDGQDVCGTSIMGLMMLAAAVGEEITISATGADSTEALDALTALVKDRFYEGE